MSRTERQNPLRVALYDASGRGGVAQYTYFLAEGLVRAGCRVAVLTSHDYEMRSLPRSFELISLFKPSWIRRVADGLRLRQRLDPEETSVAPSRAADIEVRKTSNRKFQRLRSARLRFILLLAAGRIVLRRCRVVHVQWYADRAAHMWFVRLLRRLGIRTVHTAHDLLPHEGALPGEREAFQELYRAMDSVVVFSEKTRRELIEIFGVDARSVAAIPHGADGMFAEIHQEAARAILDIAASKKVVLFFGTIRPYKGLEFLIQAFDRVRERDEDVVLLVAGGGANAGDGEADYYASIVADLQARRDVVLALDYIPVSKIPVYFSAADVVVLPYVRTYHSGVLMSAYASSRPVIVTDTGALPETVEDGRSGFVVAPEDVDSLANRISAVLDLPDRGRKMGQRARELSETIYSWSSVGERHADLYRRLLEPRPANAAEQADSQASVPLEHAHEKAHSRTPGH